MILFNVFDLAKDLFFEEKVEASVRQVLAKDMVDSAVEIFNYPAIENSEIVNLMEEWENSYGVMNIEKVMEGLINTIRKDIRRSGWDPRCLAKVEYQGDNRNFLMARVVMDLDQTMAKLLESLPDGNNPDPVGEAVSDHPDQDMLNELNKTTEKQTHRNLQILSGSVVPNLRSDKKRGWRTVLRGDSGAWGV
jgi:hypothetical protein